jgi:hypothetical protein
MLLQLIKNHVRIVRFGLCVSYSMIGVFQLKTFGSLRQALRQSRHPF